MTSFGDELAKIGDDLQRFEIDLRPQVETWFRDHVKGSVFVRGDFALQVGADVIVAPAVYQRMRYSLDVDGCRSRFAESLRRRTAKRVGSCPHLRWDISRDWCAECHRPAEAFEAEGGRPPQTARSNPTTIRHER